MLPNAARFDLQGHRGARALWPENTARAVAEAARLGVGSCELDVVLTADGVPVLCHDMTLSPDIVRTRAGHWVEPGLAVGSLTAGQLARYDVGRLRPGSRLAARFPRQSAVDGARIPHLADICAQARTLGVRLDIEIKPDPTTSHAHLTGLVLAALGDLAGPFISLRSFDWTLLRVIRADAADIPLAWLTSDGPSAHPEAVAAEIGHGKRPLWQPVWAPEHSGLRRAHVAAAHRAGIAVKPWTVNAPVRMRQLIGWGVDGLCTDRPDLAIAVLKSINYRRQSGRSRRA